MHELSMFVLTTYNRLLADVCDKSGVSLDAPDEITYEWAYIDGPKLDKEVLKYLEDGTLPGSFPKWLIPLWEAFLERDEPHILALLRQLLVFCYKTEQQPTDEQLEQSESDFEETEIGVGVWSDHFNSGRFQPLAHQTARRIVGSIIYRINWGEIVPSHGPGAVFPPRLPRDKSSFTTLYESIQSYYPFDQYFLALPSYWRDGLLGRYLDRCDVKDTILARLTAVPKDSRGPRLICVHPAESIWIQQGQRRLLEARIQSHPLTRGRISFMDQTVNGKLALQASKSREFVTLDLKEASDRVSCALVQSLFGDYAYGWLSCSRADSVQLLSGRIIKLKKWAPMGNALCFPVESLVFFSLVVAGIRSHYGENCNDVYVFGDDIIYPSRYHDGVITTLITYGLIPNGGKTFNKGFFRESCGIDAYKGTDITPLRLRKDNVNSLSAIESQLSLAHRLRQKGFDRVASFLYKSCRRQLNEHWGIYLPISNSLDNAGFFEYQNIPFAELLLREPSIRFHGSWHRWGAKRWAATGQQHAVHYGDWYHLQDSLLRLERKFQRSRIGDDAPSDRGTEYAFPRRTRLECGWLSYQL